MSDHRNINRPNEANLSGSRAPDGVSKNTAAIPAVDSPAIRSSDDSNELPTPDPVLAAINRHKAAVETYRKAVDERSRLETILPRDRCRSSITIYERKIVETDDPRWIEAEERVDKADNDMEGAAMEILNLEPATLQSAAAVLQYAVDHMDRYDGEMMGWPNDPVPDGVDPDTAKRSVHRSAEYFLMQNVAHSLWRLSSAVG